MLPFHIVGGILHRIVTRTNGEMSSVLVVPISMQHKLLRQAHAHHYVGHKGIAITLQRIGEKYCWPSMRVDIQFVGSCDLCQQVKTLYILGKTLLHHPDDRESELFLPAVQFSFNTAVRSTTNFTPFFLTYLCHHNLPHFQIGGGESKLLEENRVAYNFDSMKKIYWLTQQGTVMHNTTIEIIFIWTFE